MNQRNAFCKKLGACRNMTHSDYIDVEEGEQFENTKWVTRSHKSKNNYNTVVKRGRTNNYKKKRRKINI